MLQLTENIRSKTVRNAIENYLEQQHLSTSCLDTNLSPKIIILYVRNVITFTNIYRYSELVNDW